MQDWRMRHKNAGLENARQVSIESQQTLEHKSNDQSHSEQRQLSQFFSRIWVIVVCMLLKQKRKKSIYY